MVRIWIVPARRFGESDRSPRECHNSQAQNLQKVNFISSHKSVMESLYLLQFGDFWWSKNGRYREVRPYVSTRKKLNIYTQVKHCAAWQKSVHIWFNNSIWECLRTYVHVITKSYRKKYFPHRFWYVTTALSDQQG